MTSSAQIIRDNREMMFTASPEERASFAKKTFDAIEAEDKAAAEVRVTAKHAN